MDRQVTAWFYEVTELDGGESLETVLRRIHAIEVHAEKEREVGEGIGLRLEVLEEDGDLMVGDLTRIQSQNLPGQVTEDGTEPLPFDHLGHYVAFCYDKRANAIAIQFNASARAGRVLNYFSMFSERSQYSHLPIVSAASIEKFGRENVKSFSVAVSRIRDFSNAQVEKDDFETALENMANLHDAPAVSVKVSTRLNGDQMNTESVVARIRRLLRIREDTNAVRSIKAETFEEEDAYNFIKQLIKERDILDLPNNDPNAGRLVRMNFLKQSYEKHKQHIRQSLGVQ